MWSLMAKASTTGTDRSGVQIMSLGALSCTYIDNTHQRPSSGIDTVHPPQLEQRPSVCRQSTRLQSAKSHISVQKIRNDFFP